MRRSYRWKGWQLVAVLIISCGNSFWQVYIFNSDCCKWTRFESNGLSKLGEALALNVLSENLRECTRYFYLLWEIWNKFVRNISNSSVYQNTENDTFNILRIVCLLHYPKIVPGTVLVRGRRRFPHRAISITKRWNGRKEGNDIINCHYIKGAKIWEFAFALFSLCSTAAYNETIFAL